MTQRLPVAICSLLAILMGCATPAFAEDLKWTKYSNTEAGFEAEFPNKDVIARKMPNATHFHASIPGIDTDFRVAINKVMENPTREAALKMLRRIRDEAIAVQKLELLSSKEIDVQEYPAIEFEFKTKISDKTTAIYFTRFILVKDSFVQQQVGYSTNNNLAAEKDRFFKSLRLFPAVAPAAPVETNWTTYTSKTGHFSVEFPNKNVKSTTTGNLVEYWTHDSENESRFVLTVSPAPKLAPSVQKGSLVLFAMRDRNTRGKTAPTSTKEITVGGYPAIEFVIAENYEGKPLQATFRYINSGQMIYEQIVVSRTPQVAGAAKAVERYFSSFKVIP